MFVLPLVWLVAIAMLIWSERASEAEIDSVSRSASPHIGCGRMRQQ
jgi:hypothetical protein